MTRSIEADLAAVAEMDVVPSILDVVCRTTGLGFAAIARVTESRWVACAVRDQIELGLEPGGELQIATTICDGIRQTHQPVVIDHVDVDPAFRNHPTPAQYGFQSYISFPIFRKSGEFFGTLCALDPRPARLNNPETIETFRLFADLFAFHLEAQERLAMSHEALQQERDLADTRDQFIAVLGHDLRSPLAAIDAGVKLLRREPIGEKATRITHLMQGSVSRMAELIENVLDLAMGRLGGGIAVRADEFVDLTPAFEQVLAELRAAWPGRDIQSRFDLACPVRGDPRRLAQLLSNFVVNALTHGAEGSPIQVNASSNGAELRLTVANKGKPIPRVRSVSSFSRSSEQQRRLLPPAASVWVFTFVLKSRARTGAQLRSAPMRMQRRSHTGCLARQTCLSTTPVVLASTEPLNATWLGRRDQHEQTRQEYFVLTCELGGSQLLPFFAYLQTGVVATKALRGSALLPREISGLD